MGWRKVAGIEVCWLRLGRLTGISTEFGRNVFTVVTWKGTVPRVFSDTKSSGLRNSNIKRKEN